MAEEQQSYMKVNLFTSGSHFINGGCHMTFLAPAVPSSVAQRGAEETDPVGEASRQQSTQKHGANKVEGIPR